jgi:hypothetical protein
MRSQRESVLEWSEEDLDASTDQEAESDMDLLLDSVRDIIDRLYKLATKIRNPSTRLTYSRRSISKISMRIQASICCKPSSTSITIM